MKPVMRSIRNRFARVFPYEGMWAFEDFEGLVDCLSKDEAMDWAYKHVEAGGSLLVEATPQ